MPEDFVRNVGRASGATIAFSAPTSPATINLPTGGTEVPVINLGDPLGQVVDLRYDKSTGVYTMLAPGPVRIWASAHIANTVVNAVVQLLIQQNIGGTWTTVGGAGVRKLAGPATVAELSAHHRDDRVICEDTAVGILGTRYRLAFVSDMNTDDAIVSSYSIEFTRPAASRSTAA